MPLMDSNHFSLAHLPFSYITNSREIDRIETTYVQSKIIEAGKGLCVVAAEHTPAIMSLYS